MRIRRWGLGFGLLGIWGLGLTFQSFRAECGVLQRAVGDFVRVKAVGEEPRMLLLSGSARLREAPRGSAQRNDSAASRLVVGIPGVPYDSD